MKMFNGYPVFRLTINTINQGMNAISFVKTPANETQWVKLEGDIRLAKESEKRYVTSVVIQPNVPIFRSNFGGYYIVFTREDIEIIAKKYFKELKNNNINEEHNDNSTVNSAFMVETWFKNGDNDKSVALGFEGYEDGTWFTTYFIEDEDYWNNEIDNFTGLSLQGMFDLIEFNKELTEEEELEEIKKIILDMQEKNIDEDIILEYLSTKLNKN